MHVYEQLLYQYASYMMHTGKYSVNRNGITSKSKEGKVVQSGSDLALIEFCTVGGQIHLGSSVHLNPDIIPEYKAPQA